MRRFLFARLTLSNDRLTGGRRSRAREHALPVPKRKETAAAADDELHEGASSRAPLEEENLVRGREETNAAAIAREHEAVRIGLDADGVARRRIAAEVRGRIEPRCARPLLRQARHEELRHLVAERAGRDDRRVMILG